MDFGVEIDIGVDLIKPEAAALFSRSHCVVGTIQYPDQVGLGYLLYLKASIVGDEPEDVLQYRVSHPAFPHQSTGDQWFTESQFESYRRLGLQVAQATFKRAVEDLKDQKDTTKYREQHFDELRDNWYPPVKAIQSNFTRRANALDELVREMRADKTLVKLSDVLIPVQQPTQPTIDVDEEAKVFLFLSSVIQLVENVYLDLDLESNADIRTALAGSKSSRPGPNRQSSRKLGGGTGGPMAGTSAVSVSGGLGCPKTSRRAG